MEFSAIFYDRDRNSEHLFSKKHLQFKYDMCKKFNPKIIVELGIRCGYSAQAFLSACPKATYYGFDCNNGLYGGTNTNEFTNFAKSTLSKYNTIINDNFNTQLSKELPIPQFDFCHIDADHSCSGALSDLELCYPKMKETSVILVDDYDMHTVKKAIKIFLGLHEELCGEFIGYKDYLIRKKDIV